MPSVVCSSVVSRAISSVSLVFCASPIRMAVRITDGSKVGVSLASTLGEHLFRLQHSVGLDA